MRGNDTMTTTNIYRKKNKLCAFDSDGGQFITMEYTQAYIYTMMCVFTIHTVMPIFIINMSVFIGNLFE